MTFLVALLDTGSKTAHRKEPDRPRNPRGLGCPWCLGGLFLERVLLFSRSAPTSGVDPRTGADFRKEAGASARGFRYFPALLPFVEAQDVDTTVAAAHPEEPRVGLGPASKNLGDLDRPAVEMEAPRCFLSAVAGVALDADVAHEVIASGLLLAVMMSQAPEE